MLGFGISRGEHVLNVNVNVNVGVRVTVSARVSVSVNESTRSGMGHVPAAGRFG